MEVQLAGLKATVESGFRESNRRFDEQADKLDMIGDELKRTNGRVTRHDEQIKSLFERVKALPRDVVTMSGLRAVKEFGGWILAALLGALSYLGKL